MTTPVRLSTQELYEKKKLKRGYQGIGFGLLAAMTGAVMSAFNVSVFNFGIKDLTLNWEDGFVVSYASVSIAVLGIADCIAGVYSIVFNWATGRSIREQLRMLKLPVAWFMLLGAFLAGPLGNGLFMTSVGFCSLFVVGACSATVPLWGAVFARIFIKENFGRRGAIGITVIVIGVFIAGFTVPESASNPALGLFLALLGAAFMGLEGSASTYAADLVDAFTGAAVFRCLGAGIMEILMAFILSRTAGYTGVISGIIGNIMSEPTALLILLIWGLTQCATYLSIYGAFPRIGPSRALALNFTIPFWAIPLNFLLLRVLPGFTFDYTIPAILGGVIVAIGAIIVVIKPSELLNLRNINEE